MQSEAKKTQIAPTTPEFGNLEYGLQLALRASTARIISAFAISNPHLSVQFEKRCKDMLVLSTWMDPSQLVGVNTEDDVIRRGWNFGTTNQGAKVSVGILPRCRTLAPSAAGTTPSGSGPRGPRKLLLCKVGIGRSRVADETTAEREPVPEGYDSFFIKESVHESKAGGVIDHYQEYLIKNPAQIVPQYLILYEYDEAKERQSRERAKCENCEIEVATVFCASDAAKLCNKCDTQIHSSKLAARHIRTPLGKGNDFGSCRHHPDKEIQFFCSQCHIPVCVFCKMVGNHANGEAAKHQLVSVVEAYQTVLHEAQAHDPILQSRRAEIVNQVASVSNRAKAVEKMCGQLESHLEEIYKKALTDLRIAVREKLDILKGDELELKRQQSEIEHLEEFLRYQQEGDATQFLFSWSRHQQYRSELHDFRFFRSEIDVELDLKIAGSLLVVSDSMGSLNSAQPNSSPQKKSKALYAPSNKPDNAIPGRSVEYGVYTSHQGAGNYQIPGTIAQAREGNGIGMIGLGMPKKIQERKVQRRTSDFFAETLSLAQPYNWGAHGDDRASENLSVYQGDEGL
ncbi:hypothetical protein HDU67_007374 [Dinochytrium kinnereticum]|nr:hypothetical protein HDU67_007374 [Dinochytrium kinnereticum]